MSYVTGAERPGNLSANGRGALVLAVAFVLVALAGSPTASANEFNINACQADRINYSTQAFEDFATRGMQRAMEHLEHERTTLVLNKVRPGSGPELSAIDDSFRQLRLHRSVTIPYDRRLALMLDSGAFALEALDRSTRVPIKQLGLAVAEQLA